MLIDTSFSLWYSDSVFVVFRFSVCGIQIQCLWYSEVFRLSHL